MIKGHRDFYTGLLFIAIGLFFFATGLDLEYGTPANMGPGFLPWTVSVALIFVGSLQVVRSVVSLGPTIDYKIKQPVILIASIVVFGFILETVGALVSILLLMLATAYLHKRFSWRSFFISYVFVASLVLVFKLFLKSPLPL